MANTLLTPQMILREAQRILHAKLSFLQGVNRQYDNRFAQTGAKIGTQLDIRLPAKYTRRSGATFSAQDSVDRSTPLVVGTQSGVDMNFSSAELTMSIDDFSSRYIEPAMAVLASGLESDYLLAACNATANIVGADNTQMTYKQFRQMGQTLGENLAPTSQRSVQLSPQTVTEFGDAVKGLFQSSSEIDKQYREGMMGRTGGLDVFENTLLTPHTNGTLAGTPLTNGAGQGTSDTTNVYVATSTIAVDGATSGTTLLEGDVITFANIFEVHPETKVSTGRLKKWVVQSDVTFSGGSGNVVVAGGGGGVMYGVGNAFQNCSLTGGTTDNLAITLFGTAGGTYGQNLACHKDAFVFASADLEDVSAAGAWGAREVYDGISMRLARQYDITNDKFPTRIDIYTGFAPVYPELAVRHAYQQA